MKSSYRLLLAFTRKVTPGFFLLFSFSSLKAQNVFNGLEPLFTTPKSYVIQHTDAVPNIDGNLDDAAWQKAQWTEDFVDIEGSLKPLPTFRTQVKMLWDDSTLFIAAKLQEPNVWAIQTHHDDIIFKDNDFEIFIDPNNTTHQYDEIEVNAFNKIFDLFLSKSYRNQGNPFIGWDVSGLQSAVKIDGTLNNAGDEDKGWTIEMAIPLKSIRTGFTKTVKEGELWRINFSRVEWDTKVVNGKYVKLTDVKGKNLPEHNWVWSPQGIIDMHYPERWGYLLFTRKENTQFSLPDEESQRQYLWLIYYRQKEYQRKNGKYALALNDLGSNPKQTVKGKDVRLAMQATERQFTATVAIDGQYVILINDEGLIKSTVNK
ncbi:carbohydrate-binding family 9-like protein [Mucilaginibacter jinjuensis]|uniref:Carbohydrate-binding family 9-like protein n=1 Tax=Mucilaginibacter jinjuensis TaxID=1176721 RepID=A0ABY7T481_9SPHI|nr:carbohydrate-binding family 9-like protein [Mucilaginibacter jinjuensis]WCT11074.1 carbohydrate-binding family 9-like protein [Mucilaginibacter jinjuensis]